MTSDLLCNQDDTGLLIPCLHLLGPGWQVGTTIPSSCYAGGCIQDFVCARPALYQRQSCPVPIFLHSESQKKIHLFHLSGNTPFSPSCLPEETYHREFPSSTRLWILLFAEQAQNPATSRDFKPPIKQAGRGQSARSVPESSRLLAYCPL